MQTQNVSGFQLSLQQKRLWFLHKSNLGGGYNKSFSEPQRHGEHRKEKGEFVSSVFCAQGAIVIAGNLQLEILQAAVEQVIAKHDILRTRFCSLPGVKFPVMVVADSCLPIWENIDLSNCPQQVAIQKLFLLARQENFNLEDSLLRLSLVKLSENQYILGICLPALCADSRTIKNLVYEISEGYADCRQGKRSNSEAVQYIQFSEWENQLQQDEDAALAQEFWQQQKILALNSLKLPGECKSISTEFLTDSFHLAIAPELTEKIAALAAHNYTSVMIVLLACWQVLIWRLTGGEIVIGMKSNRREYEELQDVLGLLATWIPIKTNFTPSLRFTEVLQSTAQALENAVQWQDYFVPVGETEHILAFPIGFEFEDFPEKSCIESVSFCLEKIYTCIEPFRVKLTCIQRNNTLIAELDYDVNYFTAETIQRLAAQFHTLLENATENPQVIISQLKILSPSDYQQLCDRQPNINYPQDKCIHQLFAEQAAKTPDSIAVVFEQQQITYAELNRQANQLAHYLQKQGVKPEVVVGLCVERSHLMIVGLLGILKAGGAYLPLDPMLPKQALSLRLQDAQVSLVLNYKTSHQFEQTTVIDLDTDWNMIAQQSDRNPDTEVKCDNLVYAIYTSGSTGKPNAVAIEHRQLLNYVQAIGDRLDLPATANYATVSTLSADLGNTVIFPSLCRGGCLHIISAEHAKDAIAFAEYCRQYPIDCLKIVPAHLSALLASVPSTAYSFLPRQRLILGGEAASWELINQVQQQVPSCRIFNHYGPTETTVGILTYAVNQQLDIDTVPLGRPLAHTQVYVLDEQLQLLPIGVAGELYIGGAGLARGYLNQPELTAHKFIPNPFQDSTRIYKTGDFVRYVNGELEFLGRVDNQVKIRGFRVELAEIAAILMQHSAVRQAVVIQEGNHQRLIAYIVTRNQTVSIDDLRNFCLTLLPDYALPAVFVFLKSLPLTSNGKVDHTALPVPDVRPDVNYRPPQTKLEQVIAGVWQEVLGVEKVGVNDSFFELGGHSLLLVRVHAKLREILQVDISITHLFEFPTIWLLVQFLDRKGKDVFAFDDVERRAENRRVSRRKLG